MPRLNADETYDVRGTINATNASAVNLKSNSQPRSLLTQEAATAYPILATDCRVWDDFNALLPGTAATDDLGVIEGTFGTDAVTIQTSDAKATTVTQYLRFHAALPAEYDAGETITMRIRAGMITTVSDGTATVDVECYQHDSDGAVGSDLCTTAATSINSLTKANKDFTITPTGLTSGDILDIRVTIAITDSATGTAVIGEISEMALLLDIVG